MDDETSAQELLAAASAGGGKGASISRSANRFGRRYVVSLGILIATFLLAIEFIVPGRVLWQLIAISVFYTVGVFALTLWYTRSRRATGRGWNKRYTSAFVTTMAFYSVGIAIGVNPDLSSPWFWLPYAALTAAPLVLAGLIPRSTDSAVLN